MGDKLRQIIQTPIEILRTPGTSVEKSLLQLSAGVILVFMVMISAFYWVEMRLSDNLHLNRELVVPVSNLAHSVDEVMSSFLLRQSQVAGAAESHQLDNLHQERLKDDEKLRQTFAQVKQLSTRLKQHTSDTEEANPLDGYQATFERFITADEEFANAVHAKLETSHHLSLQLSSVEQRLKVLLESTSGISGKLRFTMGSARRKIRRDMKSRGWTSTIKREIKDNILASSSRKSRIVGDVLSSMSELNRLAGKVGLVENIDQLRSLKANELIPIRDRLNVILESLGTELRSEPELYSIAKQLHEKQQVLAENILGEGRDSLVSMRHSVFEATDKASAYQKTLAQLSDKAGTYTAYLSKLAQRETTNFNADLDTAASVTGWLLVIVVLVAIAGGILGSRSVSSSVAVLRKTNADLEVLRDELTELNGGLESKVAERTKELDESNQAMSMVLDNVEQGLATLDEQGRVLGGRSANFNRWFAPSNDAIEFTQLIEPHNPKVAEHFSLGWEEVQDGIMPLDVCISQLPRKLNIEGHHLELDYRVISLRDDIPSRTLLIATDQTELLERQQAERLEREIAHASRHMMQDSASFLEFLDEAKGIVTAVVSGRFDDDAVLFRAVHTLKGNCALFGLETMAAVCHVIESDMVDEERPPTPEEIRDIKQEWSNTMKRIQPLVATADTKRLQVGMGELNSLLERAKAHKLPQDVQNVLNSWKKSPSEGRLRRLAEQAKSLALKLGKDNLEVKISGGDVRLPKKRLAAFWSVQAHIIRNAIDHGIETAEERKAKGKSPNGVLEIGLEHTQDGVMLTISDDGAGINWDKLREKAENKGVKASTKEELYDVLFADGVSSRDSVSDVSGRGVGMSAVRETITALQGKIDVSSTRDEGTSFSFLIPSSIADTSDETTNLPSPPPSSEVRNTVST